jgi:hypothetical protein
MRKRAYNPAIALVIANELAYCFQARIFEGHGRALADLLVIELLFWKASKRIDQIHLLFKVLGIVAEHC